MSALGDLRPRPTLVLVRCCSNSGQRRLRLPATIAAESPRAECATRFLRYFSRIFHVGAPTDVICLLVENVTECIMIRYWCTIAVSLAAVLSVLPVGIVRAEPPDSPVKSGAASCARPDFRVVLDVGHTAKSPGAKSARGAGEFDFNLRLAKQIDQALLEAGFAKTVLMVTDGLGTRSMYARVARANELSANLLLSIHHDSVPDRFLEKWDYNGKPETFSDRFKGHSIFVSDGNLDPKDSLLFGSMLGQQLKARGLQYTPHYTERASWAGGSARSWTPMLASTATTRCSC